MSQTTINYCDREVLITVTKKTINYCEKDKLLNAVT